MGGIHFGSHGTEQVSLRRTAERPAPPFAALSPAWKLALMLVLVFTTALMPVRFIGWHAGLGLLLLLVVSIGRIPLRPLLLRLSLVLPFLACICLASAIGPEGGPGWRTLALRGALCAGTVTVFASITPMGTLPLLLRRLHVPSLLVTTLALMHRYLFVLVDESQRMRRARESRSLRGGKSRTWLLSADVLGRLFVRASERAERIYLAMCARAWK
jgi:cobalt/nickel transport system permease protein